MVVNRVLLVHFHISVLNLSKMSLALNTSSAPFKGLRGRSVMTFIDEGTATTPVFEIIQWLNRPTLMVHEVALRLLRVSRSEHIFRGYS